MDGKAIAAKVAAAFSDVQAPATDGQVQNATGTSGVLLESVEYEGQTTLVVPAARVKDILRFLRDDPDLRFNQLLDVTAVDYPGRQMRFDVVYILSSVRQEPVAPLRVRVKTRIADGEDIPTVRDLWISADWGERECFDMFGIKFSGHPNLKRILNPDDFYGYPLRKTFPLRGDRDPAFLEYKQTEPA